MTEQLRKLGESEARARFPARRRGDFELTYPSSALVEYQRGAYKEALIAARGEGRRDSRIIRGLIALSAPLDPEKVAEVLRREDWTDELWDGLPQQDRSRNWELYLSAARVLCEAYIEGKLT